MAFKRARKYVRKQAKRLYNAAKGRYWNPRGMATLMSDVAMLKTAVNSERKYYDRQDIIPLAPTDVAPFRLVPWDGLALGTSPVQRVGDQVKGLYTNIRMFCELQGTTLTPGNSVWCRVLLIMDKDSRYDNPLSALTLREAVLADSSTGPTQIISPYETQQEVGEGSMGERWKVIRDVRFRLDNVQQKTKMLNLSINHTRFSVRRKGQVVKYDSAASNNTNSRLYVLFLTENGSADNVLVTSYSRFCYVDN